MSEDEKNYEDYDFKRSGYDLLNRILDQSSVTNLSIFLLKHLGLAGFVWVGLVKYMVCMVQTIIKWIKS